MLLLRTSFFILVWMGLSLSQSPAQSPYAVELNGKRVLFIGNSITYAAHYVDYTLAALYLENPGVNMEAINLGLPSETASGLSEPGHAGGSFPRPNLHDRLDRILEIVKPDLIFSCYGMNDGIYLPLDEERFARYREGIQLLHNKVIEKSIPLIHLTPPVFDPKKDPAYADVLDTYSKWLLSQREESQWRVIDLHFPMKDVLLERRQTDPDFVLAEDAIHPNHLGHWVMAQALLQGVGAVTVKGYDSPDAYFFSKPLGQEVLALVRKEQSATKDAWLTHIGHERPGMKEGMPLKQAIKESKRLRKQIRSLSKKRKVN
ncbi:SGNH/GDSL hydrolase family protein [Lunatimonas lonarensis]|uniref:SGNH/GDSL hydrolase family protein n=1 Tax=Lunatimonas lonarensis TaxID=1232681 RepID=UPI001EE1C077|nr:SGNH/GDSL hydrolase family protein [Lunatimonas lonarensis]